MVNDSEPDPDGARAAERRLILSYAPAGARPAVEALLALDATLGDILRTTREPIVGQMRLTWWFEALGALDTAPPPAQPVLVALAAHVLPSGVRGAALAAMIEGWEALLDPLDPVSVECAAAARGGALFEALGGVLGRSDARLATAGQGCALADFGRGLSDAAVAERARQRAATLLAEALEGRWPLALRVCGALAHAARLDLVRPDEPPSSARRVGRLVYHRLTGR